jgi:LytS/YehU family sensor histidine kinase
VEQIRFGSRLRVQNDFDAASADCEVPPLLVQPLVENAIKHGIASLADGGEILMSAHVTNQRLRFCIENAFDPDAPAMRKSGFGLVNVRNRLAARYGAAAKLDIEIENNVYKVVMTLPCVGVRNQI